MEDNKREFIIRLEKLTRETGVSIGGCGCCGSPFLRELKKEELHDSAGYSYGDQVIWVSKMYMDEWDEHHKGIIKE